MFITVDSNGKITGRYAQKQECMDCIEVTDDQLASVPYPKWDKTEKKIINAADDQADAIGHVLDAILSHFAGDSTALARARARSCMPVRHPPRAYVSHFSKEPSRKNPIDAIQTKRAEIKAAHHKA